jgi:hypothetical protein
MVATISITDIPNAEPEIVVAGDAWKWTRDDIRKYPASDGWTLKYVFKHPTNATGFELDSTVDGNTYRISATPTTTAAITAGLYTGEGWVENSNASEKYTVWRGTLEVRLNFRAGTTAAALEVRTPSRIIYDQLLAAYQTWSLSSGQIQSYAIGDRQVAYRTNADWQAQLSYWEIRAKNEEALERLRSGDRGGKRLSIRL